MSVPSRQVGENSAGWFTRERARTVALSLATLVLVYLCYGLLRPFLPALAWALALATIALPLHRRILFRLPHPNLAAGAAVALVAVIVVVPAIFVTHRIVRESGAVTQLLQREFAAGEWRRSLERYPRLAPAIGWIESQFGISAADQSSAPTEEGEGSEASAPAKAQETPNSKTPPAVERAASLVANGVGALATSALWLAMQLFITMMALFFFFRDRHLALAAVRSIMPLSNSETDEVVSRIDDTLHATIYGSVAVAVVQGCLGGLIFWWLGLPSPIIWGAVMGLLAIVPVLGTFVIWAPTAAFLALQGETTKAIVLVAWGCLAIGMIDNLLYPYLVGSRLRFHTLLVFFSVVGGLAMFGASGVVLGPMILALSDATLDIWRRRMARGDALEKAPA